jgi:hypothetical protein
MKLLTRIAPLAALILGAAGIGTAAGRVLTASLPPSANAPSATVFGQAAQNHQESSPAEPGRPGGHADQAGSAQHQFNGAE